MEFGVYLQNISVSIHNFRYVTENTFKYKHTNINILLNIIILLNINFKTVSLIEQDAISTTS